MSSKIGIGTNSWTPTRTKKKTSQGKSVLSRPTNKHKRRMWKKYRKQG